MFFQKVIMKMIKMTTSRWENQIVKTNGQIKTVSKYYIIYNIYNVYNIIYIENRSIMYITII